MSAASKEATAYRWVMLGGISFLYFCFSLVHFSTSSLVPEIANDLDIGYSEIGTIMGAWPLLYILLSIPTGILLDRFGVRVLLYFGIGTIALSVFLRSSADSFHEMFIAFLLFGTGAPCISIGTPKLIRAWFEYNQRALALGVTTAFIAIGSISGLILSQELITTFSWHWRDVMQCYGLICTSALLTWLLIILPVDDKFDKASDAVLSFQNLLMQCLALIRNKEMQKTLCLGAGILFYLHASINWLPEILNQRAAAPSMQESARLAAYPVFVAIISAIILPRLKYRFSEVSILACSFVIAGLSFALIGAYSGLPVIILSLVLIGLVRGAVTPLASMLMMHMKGINNSNMGIAMGLFFSIGQVGGVLGPISIGYLAQKSGGFELPLFFLTAFCFILSLLVWRIKVSGDQENGNGYTNL